MYVIIYYSFICKVAYEVCNTLLAHFEDVTNEISLLMKPELIKNTKVTP